MKSSTTRRKDHISKGRTVLSGPGIMIGTSVVVLMMLDEGRPGIRMAIVVIVVGKTLLIHRGTIIIVSKISGILFRTMNRLDLDCQLLNLGR